MTAKIRNFNNHISTSDICSPEDLVSQIGQLSFGLDRLAHEKGYTIAWNTIRLESKAYAESYRTGTDYNERSDESRLEIHLSGMGAKL